MSILPLVHIQKFNNKKGNAIKLNQDTLYLTYIESNSTLHIVEIPKNIPLFFMFPKQNVKTYISFIEEN